jgi:hypothetical protein
MCDSRRGFGHLDLLTTYRSQIRITPSVISTLHKITLFFSLQCDNTVHTRVRCSVETTELFPSSGRLFLLRICCQAMDVVPLPIPGRWVEINVQSRYLAAAVPLAPQFLLWEGVRQYYGAGNDCSIHTKHQTTTIYNPSFFLWSEGVKTTEIQGWMILHYTEVRTWIIREGLSVCGNIYSEHMLMIRVLGRHQLHVLRLRTHGLEHSTYLTSVYY